MHPLMDAPIPKRKPPCPSSIITVAFEQTVKVNSVIVPQQPSAHPPLSTMSSHHLMMAEPLAPVAVRACRGVGHQSVGALRTLATEAASQLDVLGLDGN